MKNVAIVSCGAYTDSGYGCPGEWRCLKAAALGEGSFDEPSTVVSFVTCECPGRSVAPNLAMAEKLKGWAADHGRSLIHLAIAWALANPAITSALAGAKTPEQVAHNAKAADRELTGDDMAEITAILGDYNVASIHY